MIVYDKYSEVNTDGNFQCSSGNFKGVAQSFVGTNGTIIAASFYGHKTGSPSGTISCSIYAHTGTFGTSSNVTGAALASADGILGTAVGLGDNLVTFNFSTPFTPTGGTNYMIAFEFDTVGDASNSIFVSTDSSAPTHAGNLASKNSSGVWSASATIDMIFYLWIASSNRGNGGVNLRPSIFSPGLAR
jgi:hypothetical protein